MPNNTETQAGAFGVVLIYRGSWCQDCNAQLALFGRHQAELEQQGVKVAALSVDDAQTTAGLAERYKLRFPLACGADADVVSEAWGAHTNHEPHHLQSTGFLLGPDATILTAAYSTGAIGRLLPDDIIGNVQKIKAYLAR